MSYAEPDWINPSPIEVLITEYAASDVMYEHLKAIFGEGAYEYQIEAEVEEIEAEAEQLVTALKAIILFDPNNDWQETAAYLTDTVERGGVILDRAIALMEAAR